MFFLIWGFRSRTAVKGCGSFDCPICRTQQPFELRQLARWLTLFFIPVIRTRRLGEFVFCLGCRNTLQRSVLDASGDPANASPGGEIAASARSAPPATPAAGAAAPSAVRRPAPSPAAALALAPRPAAARQSAPPNADSVRLAPRPVASSRPAAPTNAVATNAEDAPGEEPRPAFGQSAFAKATYARKRRPAPPLVSVAAASEPAFFTPRR